MRVTKSSNNLPGWMNSFLTGMSKKFAGNEGENDLEKEDVVDNKDQITTVAEINISDLPKLTWNDETFYVKLGQNGAEVLNEFGNTVTTLPNVHSVEEVNKALTSNQVVVAAAEEATEEEVPDSSEFGDELNKIVAALDEENVDPNDGVVEDGTELELTASQDEDLTPESDSEETKEEGDLLTEAIATGFGELETRLAFVEDQYKTLAQEYARVKDLLNVDNGSAAIEQKHYDEQAKNTQQSIDESKKVDLTTPQGRVELSKDHAYDSTNVAPAGQSETPETTNVNTEEVKSEDNKSDETKPEEDKLPPLDTRAPKTDKPVEDKKPEVKSDEKNEEEHKDEEKEPVVAALTSRDSKIFMNAVCPECGEAHLTKSASVNNIQGVYCAACEVEYAVNLNTEEIFKYKG